MQLREEILRYITPVVINSFNQPYYLDNIINKFKMNGFRTFIVFDNLSTNRDLLELYRNLQANGIKIIYYNNNYGPRYFHYEGISNLLENTCHLYTDPDLDFEYLSSEYLSTLIDLTKKYETFKVGSALEIPKFEEIKQNIWINHPNNSNIRYSIAEWENQFWQHEIETGIFNAPIDTTLHLFNPKYFFDRQKFITGLRVSKEGFTVKHLPWYRDDPCPNEEREYYHKNDKNNWSHY